MNYRVFDKGNKSHLAIFGIMELMKRLSFLLLFLILGNMTLAQDFSGRWFWDANSDERSFEIQLDKAISKTSELSTHNYEGKHCGIFYNGGRLDCPSEISIWLHLETEDTLIGTFKSDYSGEISKVKLILSKNRNQIKWEIIEGNGQFYLPHDATLIQ